MASRENQETNLIVFEEIENKIYNIRGERVMLDGDLAEVYSVTTKRLNEQVKRNIDRFPEDFMFQLTEQEYESLRSQIATSNKQRGGRRYLPFAFTEHGAVMLASVLNSPTAIEASIQVVRAFVRLRTILTEHKELAHKIEELEKKYAAHDGHIKQAFVHLKEIFQRLPKPEPEIVFKPMRKIGFTTEEEKDD